MMVRPSSIVSRHSPSPFIHRSALFVLLLALLCGGCRLFREPTVLVRPGCQIQVIDNETGLPASDVRITIVTLYNRSDTVGVWHYTTDDFGAVAIPSEKATKRSEAKVGRREPVYEFIAIFEGGEYQYYSEHISNGAHTVRLSRNYLMAGARIFPSSDGNCAAFAG
jgi:hypothetical protein